MTLGAFQQTDRNWPQVFLEDIGWIASTGFTFSFISTHSLDDLLQLPFADDCLVQYLFTLP